MPGARVLLCNAKRKIDRDGEGNREMATMAYDTKEITECRDIITFNLFERPTWPIRPKKLHD